MVDSTGLEPKRRAAWRALAQDAGVPAYAVTFDVPEKVVRERNRARGDAGAGEGRGRAAARGRGGVRARCAGEGFAGVAAAAPVELVPPAFLGAPAAAARQADAPLPLEFGLQVSRFGWEGATARALADVARAAEEAGFTSLWLMDHFLQIPQVGREWEDMLESYTTLGYLAGVTSSGSGSARSSPASPTATSRTSPRSWRRSTSSPAGARCAGSGRRWFEREHQLYGWAFPPLRRALRAARGRARAAAADVGPGSPRFEGRTTTVAEATCYPRPLQERIPILVGGSGERRTLRLVARHADACNLFGDAAVVRHKLAVLRAHCETEGRDPAEIAVTHLAPARVVAAGEPREGQGAATVEEHVGRYRELAEAGVQTAIVGLSDARGPASVSRFADVIAAFRGERLGRTSTAAGARSGRPAASSAARRHGRRQPLRCPDRTSTLLAAAVRALHRRRR